MPTHLTRIVLAMFAAFAVAAPAAGQTIINQAKATNGLGGCDTPGFPVTLCKAGSYKLLGNLTVPKNTHGISITVSAVTLDLNGFHITNVVGCSPDRGEGHGIVANGALSGVVVVNGMVRCMGLTGVALPSSDNRVERVSAVSNGAHGIWVGANSIVKDSTANSNNSIGLVLRRGSTATGNTANNNQTGVAFETDEESGGSTIVGNTMRGNMFWAMFLAPDDGYGHNVVTGSIIGGISMGDNICNSVRC